MDKGISQRLRELRLQTNFSQQDITSRIGVSVSLISSIEQNQRYPSLDTLVKLSDVYCCSTDYILGKSSDRLPLLNASGLTNEQIQLLQRLIETMKA